MSKMHVFLSHTLAHNREEKSRTQLQIIVAWNRSKRILSVHLTNWRLFKHWTL